MIDSGGATASVKKRQLTCMQMAMAMSSRRSAGRFLEQYLCRLSIVLCSHLAALGV